MNAKQIKITDKKYLDITWDNDSESLINLKYLRDECPCANCKGETILLKTYRPPKLEVVNSDSYKIKQIKTVGDYAIQITWKDGHNTGIYSWEYLKNLDKDQLSKDKQKYDGLL
jgi:DUF971 family protein